MLRSIHFLVPSRSARASAAICSFRRSIQAVYQPPPARSVSLPTCMCHKEDACRDRPARDCHNANNRSRKPLLTTESRCMSILDRYEIREWRNAIAVLKAVHPKEWEDINAVLGNFRLKKSAILQGGGAKTQVARALDSAFYALGWKEKSFDIKLIVDGQEHPSPTHEIDCYKNRVALEVEWNNKDTFFDRDLNNFRLLFELRAIDVGVIITRSDELNSLFRRFVAEKLISKDKYVDTTTHMGKLIPRLEGGSGGGCPVLAIGIGMAVYEEDV